MLNFVQIILWIHVAAGSAALAAGLLAMGVGKRRGAHTRLGEAYHWLVLVVCISAVVVVLGDFRRLRFFLYVAAISYGFALAGYLAGKRRWRGWLVWHVSGQLGSYIAIVTAFLVANWHDFMRLTGLRIPLLAAWIAPSLIGTPLITWVNLRIARRQRPPAPQAAGSESGD